MYIERKKRWKEIYKYGEENAERNNLKMSDVAEAISEYRRQKYKKSILTLS